MSANSAFFFDLVHQCAAPCTTLHHQLPPPIHFQGAAAVGYDVGTLWRLPKSETPGTLQTSEGFCAVTTIGSGESIRRDSSAHLDPLHSLACTSSAWGMFTTSAPCVPRLGPAGVGH